MRVTFAPGAVRFSTVFVRPISGSAGTTRPGPGGVTGSVGSGSIGRGLPGLAGSGIGLSGSAGSGRVPVASAMLVRSAAGAPSPAASAATVHSKVMVASAPPGTLPAGTVRTRRPFASAAASANFPTSEAATSGAFVSALPATPPRGLSSRTLPSSSSRQAGRGSRTTTPVHSDPAVPFAAVIV